MRGRLKKPPSLNSRILSGFRSYFGFEEAPVWLRMSRLDETEGIMMLGDPGTGKSQTIHHFLIQIATRDPSEAVVIYDPACEFVRRHYSKRRGDIILNPLDQRSPYWSPSNEVRAATDKKLVSESFLPSRSELSQASTSGFFLKAARSILGRMLEFKPTPSDLVTWLGSADTIDALVSNTEQAHLIPRNAHGQRAGVLGVLSDLGETLRLLPTRESCDQQITLTDWAAARNGWIFITSTIDSREALRPLQAVFINLLMKRLMSVSPEWGQAHPCWLIVDEVHALHRLSALYETETEGRKYGIKLIQGTQGKPQYEEYYQTLAKTMLAAPRLKLFFRCGEPESARWVSDTIGEVEVEKPKIGTTASVEDKGRDSLNYSTITEHRSVVSKEQIMSLPDMHGYWKYGDVVVPFRLPLARVKVVTEGFIRRKEPADQQAQSSIATTIDESLQAAQLRASDQSKMTTEYVKQPKKDKAPEKRSEADQRKLNFEVINNQKVVGPMALISQSTERVQIESEVSQLELNDSSDSVETEYDEHSGPCW